MNVEARKLSIIERFMKFKDEFSIQELENTLSRLEMNNRIELSLDDIEKGRVRQYEEFKSNVTEWITVQRNSK
jgi:hypothetical protein